MTYQTAADSTPPITQNPYPGTTQVDAQAEAARLLQDALYQVKKVVVGQDRLVERVLVSLLANGHCLIEGYPGLAKTLTASTTAKALGGSMTRIQFTPDLVPADLIGTRIWRPTREDFDIEWGPIFANLVLADEINRAPAKVQSALLEAMSERQVSIGGQTRALPDPFIVLATQNPIESEGVYALPEAQRDRFLMHVLVPQPSYQEETAIATRMGNDRPVAETVLTTDQLRELQKMTDEVFVHHAVQDYAVRLIMSTRDAARWGFENIAPYISLGASPRGTLGLISAARAMAVLRGRRFVVPQDIFDVAPEVLRHRITLTYDALADGITPDHILNEILSRVQAPQISPATNVSAPTSSQTAQPTLVNPLGYRTAG